MKGKLLKLSLALSFSSSLLLSTSPLFSINPVMAQETVDFSQGDMSEVDYLNHMIDVFRNADYIQSINVQEHEDGSTSESINIFDATLLANQSTYSIDGAGYTIYTYPEGQLIDAVPYYQQLIPDWSQYNPDYESKVDQLAERLGEDTFVLDAAYGEEIPNPFQSAFPEDLTFTSTETEGNIVRGYIEDFQPSELEQEFLANVMPAGTTYNYTFEVNPDEEIFTLIIETIFPEEQQSEDDIEGISAFYGTTSTGSLDYSIIDEGLPEFSEFNTITYEEFQEILAELELELLF